MATVIDRVDRLEEALANFVTSVGLEFNKVYNSQRRTEAELRAFQEEMRGAAGRGSIGARLRIKPSQKRCVGRPLLLLKVR